MCTNDTVSRWTDSTTRTPLRRRSDVGDIIPRRLRVPHTAATITVASAPASMTRDGPAGHHQEETTRHVRQDATTPAAPVGCAIPPPTTHSGSIVQLRERLSPAVHPGWAHAGRQRAGWAKGAWSWRTPSGSRTPPRRTATAIGSVQGAMHDGCCLPDRSVQHRRAGPGEAAWATTSRHSPQLPQRLPQRGAGGDLRRRVRGGTLQAGRGRHRRVPGREGARGLGS
jgi:hypothetical protein